MSKLRILYIDDEQEQVGNFIRKLSEEEFDVMDILVNSSTSYQDIMEVLEEKNFDFLIVDYHLNEKGNCGFEGDEIVSSFVKKFPHFPVVLLTSHENEAITHLDNIDLEKIQGKNEYSTPSLLESFISRIKRRVAEYRADIEKAESRVKYLILRKASGVVLSATEEAEATRLDTFLDEVLDGEAKKISDQIKETNEEKISSLLDKTDLLIAKLEKYESVQKKKSGTNL